MKLITLATVLTSVSATVLLEPLHTDTLKRGQIYDVTYLFNIPYVSP